MNRNIPPAPVGTINPAALLPQPPAHIGRLVLVVEDEPALRDITEMLLLAHGYQVIVAANGQEALRCLRARCPDLIVLDLNMPVMNGWQFCAERRDRMDDKCAAVPVLLLTGEDDPITHAASLHAVGAIQKPCDPDDFLHAVFAAIGSQAVQPSRIRPT